MKVGYARVSTKGQGESLETQREALAAAPGQALKTDAAVLTPAAEPVES